MKRTVTLQPDTLDDAAGRALLDDPEVTLLCPRCRAEIEVLRLRGEPDGPVHLVRCPKNENHYSISYHHRVIDWDAVLAAGKNGEGDT